MKHATVFMLTALISVSAIAAELTPARFVKLELLGLKEEIRHLKFALDALKEKDNSKAALYEEEFNENKRTVAGLLEEHDITFKEYYEYPRQHKEGIAAWLEENPLIKDKLENLQEKKQKLIEKNAKFLKFDAEGK